MNVYKCLELVCGMNYLMIAICSPLFRAWICMYKYSICCVPFLMLRLPNANMNKAQSPACPQSIYSLIKEMDFNRCWADKFHLNDSEYCTRVVRVALTEN